MKKHVRINKKRKIESTRQLTTQEVLAILLLIAIVVLYFISLGNFNLLEADEKSKRLLWIEKRLESLNSTAKNKKELKEQLDKEVKKWFFFSRCILGSFYLAINVVAFIYIPKSSLLDRLSVLLNFNQAFLFLSLVILFIKYETPKDFKIFIKLIHLFVQKWVYKSHRELSLEIESIEKEIEVLSKEKNEIESVKQKNKSEVVTKGEENIPTDIEDIFSLGLQDDVEKILRR